MNSLGDIREKGKTFWKNQEKAGPGCQTKTILRKGLITRGIGVAPKFYITNNFFFRLCDISL